MKFWLHRVDLPDTSIAMPFTLKSTSKQWKTVLHAC